MAPRITCHCGECPKCKRREYMRDYYRRNAQRIRDIANASRNRRLEAVREYDRKRGHRSYGEHKERARRRLYRAMLSGRVERKPCEVCGDPKVDAHHDDYGKPFDVRWLCRAHHMALHRRIT
jgi:hypothetical protein